MAAWEQAVLGAALGAGAKALATILSGIGSGRRSLPVRCACGATMGSVGLRDKAVVTALGPVIYRRSLFVCPACGTSRFPGDRALDMEHTGFSPGVRRMMARASARGSFVEARCRAARQILPRSGARRLLAATQIRYFEKNAERMRYAAYRAQGLFVGSGVVEAGCRSVVGLRCKKPGMFWSRSGAHAILQTRCSLLSRRYDADWDDRAYERTKPAA